MKCEAAFQCLAQPELTASVCGVNQQNQQGLGARSRSAEASGPEVSPSGKHPVLPCPPLPAQGDLNEQNPECSGSAGSLAK